MSRAKPAVADSSQDKAILGTGRTLTRITDVLRLHAAVETLRAFDRVIEAFEDPNQTSFRMLPAEAHTAIVRAVREQQDAFRAKAGLEDDRPKPPGRT